MRPLFVLAVFLLAPLGAAQTSASGSRLSDDLAAEPSWDLTAGETEYEGESTLAWRREGYLIIQLVNEDAVNMGMVILDDSTATREVLDAFFALGRDDACFLMPTDPPFSVRIDPGDPETLRGT